MYKAFVLVKEQFHIFPYIHRGVTVLRICPSQGNNIENMHLWDLRIEKLLRNKILSTNFTYELKMKTTSYFLFFHFFSFFFSVTKMQESVNHLNLSNKQEDNKKFFLDVLFNWKFFEIWNVINEANQFISFFSNFQQQKSILDWFGAFCAD